MNDDERDKSERPAFDNPRAEAFGRDLRESFSKQRRVAVFDLPSLFWTVAKAREGRDKAAAGAALAALRHARDLARSLGCDRVVFASERKPRWRESASVQGVRAVPEERVVEGKGSFHGCGTTKPLIPYKVGRAEKSAELKVELAALEAALAAGGFPVLVAEVQGVPFDPDEPEGGQGSGARPCYFEADDVAASLALKLAEAGDSPVVVSNDWDLAALLADLRVRLARVSLHDDRDRCVVPADVVREFGVAPAQLWEFLALAGDNDFRPYPGAPRGAARSGPGIGPVAAKEVLKACGGFDQAVSIACYGVPPVDSGAAVDRAFALIKAGGEARAQCARQLAKLRYDVPLPALGELLGGAQSWDGAEFALPRLGAAAAVDVALAARAEEAPKAVDVAESGLTVEEVAAAMFMPEVEGSEPRGTVGLFEADLKARGAVPASTAAPFSLGDLSAKLLAREGGKLVSVVLTRSEFWSLAPLVMLSAAGLLGEVEPDVARVVAAIRSGSFAESACRRAFVGSVSVESAASFAKLAEVARGVLGSSQLEPGDAALAERVRSTPHLVAFNGYGRDLTRV